MTHPDQYLRNQVSHVASLVGQLTQQVSVVDGKISTVDLEAKETRNDLAKLHAAFNEYVRKADREVRHQRALTLVGNLQDQIHQRFGHHDVVRNSAVGMLKSFDAGVISEETAVRISEELMIQSNSYWLAPCLVALAAWASDDRETCDQAIEVAFGRSHGRTSLFMALVLRRQGRPESAVRWLRHYLMAQDPAALGREFATVLEAVSQGAFGPAGLAMVREILERWRAQLAQDDAVQAAQIGWWKQEIEKYRGGSAADRYKRLAAVSPQWPAMDAALRASAAHTALIGTYSAMMAEEIQPSDRIEDTVDDILDQLVREYDTEELPLRRELAKQQAIVTAEGDEDRAGRDGAPQQAALEAKMDYLSVQTMSALTPETIGVSRATQRVAVASCSEWFARAHAAFTMDYRRSVPADVEAALEPSHNLGAQTFNLPRWSGSFTKPVTALEQSLAQHWDMHTKAFLDNLVVQRTGQIVACVAASLLAFVLILGCGHGSPGAVFGGLVVGGLIGGIWGYSINRDLNRGRINQEQWRQRLEDFKRDSLAQLRAAAAELGDWQSEYRRNDAAEADLRTLIADLATAQHGATPHERRTIEGA